MSASESGYNSMYWHLRLVGHFVHDRRRGGFTRRRWTRWRRFINRFRRRNLNSRALNRRDAWLAFAKRKEES